MGRATLLLWTCNVEEVLFKHIRAYVSLHRQSLFKGSQDPQCIKDERTCFVVNKEAEKNDEYERKIFFPKVLPEAPVWLQKGNKNKVGRGREWGEANW